jgi:predicted Zn-ribbon and HTH transcriptional regulator
MGLSIKELTCKACGYKWWPKRPQLPKVCPVCKRTTWRVVVQK